LHISQKPPAGSSSIFPNSIFWGKSKVFAKKVKNGDFEPKKAFFDCLRMVLRIYYLIAINPNRGASMRISRLTLPFALTLAFFANAIAADDEDMAPRGSTGTITIITDPPNSEVFLDGESLGKSPIIKRSFRSGPLKLIVQDQGKELINTRFNVWPNKDNKFEGSTVMPAGTIKVSTIPNKCYVYMDGERADRTDGGPLTLNSVDAGNHTIGAECPGKKFYEELIDVKGEQTTEVVLDAVKRKSTVKIQEKKAKKASNDDDE
jgi:hypothetical protein